MLAREKSTSLAELFSIELKFTVDTLNDWFSNTIKPKFLEPNDIKKHIFTKENPIVSSKTISSICGFLIDVEDEDWYDFAIQHCYATLPEIKDDIHHIEIPKKTFTFKNILFSDRLIAFIYSSLIKFSPADKIKDVPLPKILLRM